MARQCREGFPCVRTDWWLDAAGGGNSVSTVDIGSGLFAQLLSQPNNGSSNLKVRIAPTTFINQNPYNASNTYIATTSIEYPPQSDLVWIALQNVGTNEVPSISPKWELANAIDFLQDTGEGDYFRYTLQRNGDGWVRLRSFERGNYALTDFEIDKGNFDGYNTFTTASSTTSLTIPTTHPTSRTLTINTGLTIPNSTTIGTCNNTFSIPTSHPTMLNVTLPAGLSLTPGTGITFYGNSNNFFVFIVARYNSTTGATYGGTSLHVGSGSFSSWTLKTERIVTIFRNADQLGTNMHGLVQSYDPSTGSLTVNSVSKTGSGSATDWTIRPSKTPNAPQSTQTASFNFNSAPIGCWFTGSAPIGDMLSFRCQKDNRGTGWKVIYVDGPDIANPPADVIIDTYNSSVVTVSNIPVWTGLSQATVSNPHKFLAISITSPSGLSANSDCWIYQSTTPASIHSFSYRYQYDFFTATVKVGYELSQSLGEVVFKFGPFDQVHSDARTWPFHGNGTDTPDPRHFFVDGVEVDGLSTSPILNPYLYRYRSCTSVYLLQSGHIYADTWPAYGNFATYSSKHSFDRYGFSLDYLTMTLLQDQWIDQWYANLLAIRDSYGVPNGQIIGQNGVSMTWNPVNGSGQFAMPSNFKGQNNYIFTSTTVPDLLIADYWPDVTNWRIGESNRGTDHIENVAEESVKFRPYPFFDVILPSGFTFTIKNRKYLGHRGSI